MRPRIPLALAVAPVVAALVLPCAGARSAWSAAGSASPASASISGSASSSTSTFAVRDASVAPRQAYFAGAPIRISFEVDAAAPLALQVDIVREATRRPVRHFELPAVAPGVAQHLDWDGVTGGGEVAPNGTYRVRVRPPATAEHGAPAAGTARNAGTFTLHGHIYPIRGPHADRGPIGYFGVPRNGGRTHEGYDVNAACGTKLVAARGGRVVRSIYDPVLYGNLVIIHGDRTERDYWYAHLEHASPLQAGDHVRTGERVGRVGKTGNARTIGCHLHFEIRRRGVPIDPAPELHAWDAWS